MPPYTVYGWRLSYFTGKLHSYMRYKNIPFIENNVNIYTLYQKVLKSTGAVVMPVVTTPDGHWLQDTRHIINVLEKQFPDKPSVFPLTPKRLFISSLFESWGDEWWIPIGKGYII
jgi:glutathione S-transferase